MAIELEGTVAKVAVGYSLKVPGAADYSSEDAHASYSVEFDISGKTFDQVQEELEAIQAQLHTNAKLAAFAQLGVEFDTSTAGVIQPVIKTRPKAAKTGGGYTPKPQAQGGGGGGFVRTPPKVANSDKPVVVLGGVAYYDQRPAKESGTYKEGAADFKSVNTIEGRYSQHWIINKDGSVNEQTTGLLEEAGVAY
jgi:hypothetical protein